VVRLDDLAVAGRRVLDAIEHSPLHDLGGSLATIGASAGWIVRTVAGREPPWLAEAGQAALAGACLLLLAYVWWTLVTAILIRWARARLADFLLLARQTRWSPYATWLLWPFIGLVLLLPPAVIAAMYLGRNPWLLIVPPLALLLVVLYLVLWFLQLARVAPRSRADMAPLLARLRASAVAAVTPGSEDPQAPGARWRQWQPAYLWLGGLLLPLGLISEAVRAMDTVGGLLHASVLSLAFASAALVLQIRLFMLARRRGCAVWLATLVAWLPQAVAVWLAAWLVGRFASADVLVLGGLFTLPSAGVLYAVADRWMRPRAGVRAAGLPAQFVPKE
jgi:hypothetical protein